MKHLFLIVLTFFILQGNVLASPLLILTDKAATYNISNHLSYHIDSTKILSIDNLLANEHVVFVQNTKSPINLGVKSQPVWVKFDLQNNLPNTDWILEVKYPTLNNVTFFIVDHENKVDTVIYSGKDYFDEEGKSYSYSIFFKLPVEPNEKYQVFMKIETESFIILPIYIRSTNKFFNYFRNELTLFNLLYGVLISFMVFNLVLFILTREKSYLLLSIYLTILSLNAYFLHGYGFNFFPRIDAFYASRMRLLLFGMGSIFFLIFSINYLDLKKYKSLYFIIRSLIILSVIFSITIFFKSLPQSFFTKTSLPLFSFGAIICIYSGIMCYAKGERVALYYIISFMFITVASVIYSLTLFSILPFNNFTFNINLFGSLLFSLFLTIGLIEKITAIKKEKLKSQFLESMVNQLNTEICERKKIEQFLRESENRFRLLFDLSPQPIALTEIETGKIIDINHQMVDFLEFTKEESINKTSVELKILNHQTRAVIINRIKTDGFIKGFELQLRHKSGKISDNLAYMQAINLMGTNILVSVFIDITEKKKKEQKIIQSEKELRELNATKDKFFSIIGHDLMNPFNAMMGFIRLLIESSNENDKEKCLSYLLLIDQSATRILNLLQNLLIWSKTQSNNIIFNPLAISAIELITNSTDILKGEANFKQVELVIDIKDNDALTVDHNMICVVIRNLVSNAIKYSNKGSKVFINYQKDDNNYLFSVKDLGSGIEPERMPDLFNSITEKSKSNAKQISLGFGLGLILCADFVSKHNGRIWAESELGKGSTFYFSLPIITPSN